jgi:two-component system, response regulator FlrC
VQHSEPEEGSSPAPLSAPPFPPWMAGTSPAFRAFEREVRLLAASDVGVLIEGESGVGKNLTARGLHQSSARARGPLVEVDLSALAPSLLEAELFGHEEGAFTGAHRARGGRFQRAAGGTIVLDGVERLPEALQGKLLRVLQERQVEPLGAEAPVPIDVRILATTGRDLAGMVRERRFREDLYFRLAVVRLRVPALRERTGDVPDIARGMIEHAARRLGVPPRPLSAGALDRLAAHAWPGNLRELENAIERSLVLAPLGSDGAPVEIAAGEIEFLSEAVTGVPERLAREALAHGITLERFESALLAESLREQRGNIAAAARAVGLSRRAFEIRNHRHAESSRDDEPRAEDTRAEGESGEHA